MYSTTCTVQYVQYNTYSTICIVQHVQYNLYSTICTVRSAFRFPLHRLFPHNSQNKQLLFPCTTLNKRLKFVTEIQCVY